MTELATLEDRLSESLDSDGYLLKYFISATSMAFASASASATYSSENLRISSDYYKAIESHGRELQTRLEVIRSFDGRPRHASFVVVNWLKPFETI